MLLFNNFSAESWPFISSLDDDVSPDHRPMTLSKSLYSNSMSIKMLNSRPCSRALIVRAWERLFLVMCLSVLAFLLCPTDIEHKPFHTIALAILLLVPLFKVGLNC